MGAPGWLTVTLAVALALVAMAGCSGDDGDFASQGTQAAPFNLGTAPIAAHAGSVGPEASSYYTVTVTELTAYTITVSQLLDDADLVAFETSFGGTTFCASANSGQTSEVCTATTSSGITTLAIQIKPFTQNGTSFLLTVQ